MYYLITDQDNKTFRDVIWGENVSHEEDNSNYQFYVYKNLETAKYMYPSYEGTKNPKFWQVESEDLTSSPDDFRLRFRKITTIKEEVVELPSNSKRIIFGILCAMNLVLNPLFRDWAINYLEGTDTTKETAHKISQEITSQIATDIPVEHEYICCVHAVLASVMLEDAALFAANAAHRAYHDSVDWTEYEEENRAEITNLPPIDLEQMAIIANTVPAIDIAQMLK